jgi:hypothetical protein
LKRINLRSNFLSSAAAKRLRVAYGTNMDAGDQRQPYDEDDRYVSVGE